jgi:peroxiredoxin family protein
MFGIDDAAPLEKAGPVPDEHAGMGPKMIRGVMKKKHIASLEELIASARKNGVELVACSMSMDVMGIRRRNCGRRHVLRRGGDAGERGRNRYVTLI